MAEKKVQLKEQEIVGQEVVLSDIYPKTDTTSIVDDATGIPLDVKLDYLAELINDKLTRVVNSVNNRTGVVVLDAEDVGLGNVDNISFAEMKEWIQKAITNAFGNKHVFLFENYSELQAFLQQNQEVHLYAPFYVECWDLEDDAGDHEYRGAIGYFLKKNDTLNEVHRFINTIGHNSDGCLAYTKGDLNVQLSPISDNLIWKPEPSGSLAGLMVNYGQTGEQLYMYEFMYHIPQSEDGDTQVHPNLDGVIELNDFIPAQEDEDNYAWIKIYINDGGEIKNPKTVNDTSLPNHLRGCFLFNDVRLRPTSRDRNSTFRELIYVRNNLLHLWQNPNIPSIRYSDILQDDDKVCKKLILRSPMIGILRYETNSSWGDTGRYILNFRTINATPSYGLKQDEINDSCSDGLLSIATTEHSGIQAVSHPYQYEYVTDQYVQSLNLAMNSKFGQYGLEDVFDETDVSSRKGGMYISTDASMCTYSYYDYGLTNPTATNNLTSRNAANWFASTPYYLNTSNIEEHRGYLDEPTFVGINLVRGTNASTNQGSVPKFIPLSGLKILDPADTNMSKHYGTNPNQKPFWWTDLGLRATSMQDKQHFLSEETIADIDAYFSNMYITGGLMVNVGNGLEIVPQKVPSKGEDYNLEGKVSVRLGDGFQFDKEGRVTYDPETLSANGGSGNFQAISIIDSHRPNDVIEYRMLPSTIAPNMVKAINKINLGDGLLLQIESEDLKKMMVYEMTIYMLDYFRNQSYTYHDTTTNADVTINVSDYYVALGRREEDGDPYVSPLYGDVISGFDRLLTELVKNYDTLEAAYEDLKYIRDAVNEDYRYSTIDIVHQVSLSRLKEDELASTTTVNVDLMKIQTLLEHYAERRSNGRPIGYIDGEASGMDVIDYSEAVIYTNYENLPILESCTPAQQSLFMHFINTAKSIRQAMYTSGIWVDNLLSKTFLDSEYKENSATDKQLTIQIYDIRNDLHEYVSRMDTSGLMALTLLEMQYFVSVIYNQSTNPKVFASSQLILESGPYRILNDDNEQTLCRDFSYKVKPKVSELRFGDIIVSRNMVWMFGGTKDNVIGGIVGSVDLIGVDFNSGSHIIELLTNIDRMTRRHSDYVTKRDALLKFFSVEEITIYMNNTETKDEILNKPNDDVLLAIRYGKEDEDASLTWRFEDEWTPEEDAEEGSGD